MDTQRPLGVPVTMQGLGFLPFPGSLLLLCRWQLSGKIITHHIQNGPSPIRGSANEGERSMHGCKQWGKTKKTWMGTYFGIFDALNCWTHHDTMPHSYPRVATVEHFLWHVTEDCWGTEDFSKQIFQYNFWCSDCVLFSLFYFAKSQRICFLQQIFSSLFLLAHFVCQFIPCQKAKCKCLDSQWPHRFVFRFNWEAPVSSALGRAMSTIEGLHTHTHTCKDWTINVPFLLQTL